jgi:hypothetical protein
VVSRHVQPERRLAGAGDGGSNGHLAGTCVFRLMSITRFG